MLFYSPIPSLALLGMAYGLIAPNPDLVGLDTGVFDIDSLIKQPMILQPEVFKQAIRIISSLESAPSCHRLAARTLLDSCQSLEASKNPESNVALDQVKSLFAARLAVCELNGAHAAVPTQCLAMIPKHPSAENHGLRCRLPGSNCERSQENPSGTRYNFEKLSQRQIHQCLNTLESRPQWWTSYSNARQNAVVMCHAARSEVDREQLLDTHKKMAKVSSDMSQAISEASDRWSERLKAQEEFARHMKRLQASVIGDMEATERKAQGFFHSMVTQVEAFASDTFARFAKSATTAADTIDDLNSRLKQSVAEADSVKDKIKDTMESFSYQHNTLADAQHQNEQLTRDSALALRNSLDTVHSQQIEPLELALRDLRTMIDAQTQLMQLVLQKQGSMDGRLEIFNKTIHNLQTRASMAEESLKLHVEAQGLLFENLTLNMATSNELASSIKANLEDAGRSLAVSVFGFLNPFSGLSASWPVFAVIAAVLSYLVLGAEATRRIAVVELAFYASCFLSQQLSHLGQYWAGFQEQSTPLISAQMRTMLIYSCVGAMMLIIIILACVLRHRSRRTENVIVDGDFFADALPMRKRVASLLPKYTL